MSMFVNKTVKSDSYAARLNIQMFRETRGEERMKHVYGFNLN